MNPLFWLGLFSLFVNPSLSIGKIARCVISVGETATHLKRGGREMALTLKVGKETVIG